MIKKDKGLIIILIMFILLIGSFTFFKVSNQNKIDKYLSKEFGRVEINKANVNEIEEFSEFGREYLNTLYPDIIKIEILKEKNNFDYEKDALQQI
ncbi:MAG: hypothetical protein ACRCTA_01100 [Bacilli bacterium]